MIQEIQTVSTETALRVVADPCRRSILSQLIDSEETVVTIDTLVDRISPENPPPKTTGTHADPLLIDVHHIHLPKLEDANLIEYDPRTKMIRYTPNERVERVLRFVTEDLE
ncbi:DUF7344 domain-containing protein [Halosolutus gelatinilyticus]|uniref:DUF7344 domain-containing protein n=1 Tax=Halosolutus gelatinilyticus TaxID=2931975 RepID=UPI001FF38BE5|nr:hypothetical protein [Halosolutus gelatinilyticus]